MSVYKDKRSPFWQFDFELDGHRFYGSTKARSKREAEAVERTEKAKARERITKTRAARSSLRLDDISGRYWEEVGRHHAGSDNTWRQIEKLIEHFGKDKFITEVTDDDVTKLVAWRRGHHVIYGKRRGPLISPFTVNDLTEQLKKLFTRAKLWGVRFDHEPQWKKHWLDEPEERVRELHDDEGDRLEESCRKDYAPFFAFAKASGLRLKECVTLAWPEVHWGSCQIVKRGKGGKTVTVPITDELRRILWPLRGHHAERVFTYVAVRTRDGRVADKRYPLTYNGAKIRWRRQRKKAAVVGFRFHDYRHNVGTKLLRKTGNLKLVQKALNHGDLKSTTRYAHVLNEEVAAAMDGVTDSRKRSRNGITETRKRAKTSA